ncbi:MAG: transglutaminase-like domain-containing protein [Bacteroidota bacterium]
MKETELKALISLLDDEDPSVKTHVEQQLLELGELVLPQLERAWESSEDELLQSRIEDVIHLIQSRQSILSLRDWRAKGGGDLLDGWFYTTQYHYPELDFELYRKAINRLVNRIWLELRSGMNIPEQLMVVNRMLFNKEKYRANQRSPHLPQNYYLNTLIETKQGSPLSLGLIYMAVCAELQIPVEGILLPDYFVLVYRDSQNEFFIDVFNQGAFFVRNDLTRFLEEMKVEDKAEYYEPSSKIYLILALIERQIRGYERAQNDKKAKSLKLLLKGIEVADGNRD